MKFFRSFPSSAWECGAGSSRFLVRLEAGASKAWVPKRSLGTSADSFMTILAEVV